MSYQPVNLVARHGLKHSKMKKKKLFRHQQSWLFIRGAIDIKHRKPQCQILPADFMPDQQSVPDVARVRLSFILPELCVLPVDKI